MKNLRFCMGALLFSSLLFCSARAQRVVNPDSIKKELDGLLISKTPSDQQILKERLKSLAASDHEMDMAIAGSYYYRMKNAKAADSVFAAEVIKFPKGLQARINAQQAITSIKSLPEMEKAYVQFIESFPPDAYPTLPFGEDRLTYDRIRSSLANGYAKEKNVAKANYYASLLEADFWKVHSYSMLADIFYVNEDLTNAALYQKRAVQSATPYAEGKMGNNAAANYAVKNYAGACGTYARILYEQKKYNAALKYMEIAVNATKSSIPEFNYTYAEILAALNRNQEAYEKIEAVIKSGKASEKMSNLFQVLYIKTKGSDVGLADYQADIHKGVLNNLRERLANMMVNEPAPVFALTDIQGNLVNLADLKGKIVILDFWATWCVPCKASFPAMQIAVDKYKNDPNIKFLFIHTWERTTKPAEEAAAFITSMKYSFKVLMDTKDVETKANKVVDSYHVSSIPAKFVIDEEGNIRFKLRGFDGSQEAAVDEISIMIDMIRTQK